MYSTANTGLEPRGFFINIKIEYDHFTLFALKPTFHE